MKATLKVMQAHRALRLCGAAFCLITIATALTGCGAFDWIMKEEKKSEAISKYNESVSFLNAKKYHRAAIILKEALELDPDSPLIHKALGRALVECGRPKAGLEHLRVAREKDPDDPEALEYTALAYLKNGQFDKSIEYFNKCLSEHPRKFKKDPELAGSLKEATKQNDVVKAVKATSGGEAEDQYFAYATYDLGVSRWNRLQLRVFVDEPHNLEGYKPEWNPIVMDAFERWSKASNGKLKFKKVTDRKKADIKCLWVETSAELKSPMEAGETQTSFSLNGLQSATVRIVTTDRGSRRPEPKKEIHATALHEAGHALGIHGHSPNPHDIMFFTSVLGDNDPDITPRDGETLRMIYSSAKAYIPPKGSKREQEAERIAKYNENIAIYNAGVHAFNAKNYQRAIEKANEYLALVPTDDRAKGLIEESYAQMAQKSLNAGNLDEAEGLLKQALAVSYTKGPRRSVRSWTNSVYSDLKKKRASG